MKKKKASRKKKIFLGAVFGFLVLFVAYACLAVVPFSLDKSVSREFKENFSVADFYGDGAGVERVKILDDPQESFYYRLSLIARAREEIVFSSYSTHDGASTRAFFGALLKKADEGVKVKIALDGKFSGINGGSAKKTAYALMAHENVELYFYNETNVFRPTILNACLHDKYLIADGRYMIFGGRNVGDKYYKEEGYSDPISYDREVFVYQTEKTRSTESAVVQVREYFDRILAEKVCKRQEGLSSGKRKKGKARQAELIGLYLDRISEDERYAAEPDFYGETVAADKITLIANPTHPHMKEPLVGYQLYRLALSSKDVIMQSPYTALKGSHMAYLNELGERCDSLALLTNSLASTPNLMAYSNYYVRREKILETGVSVYEYQGDGSVHAKTYIFDDRLTAVGSFNLDERSLHIDTESMLVIDSAEFNRLARETLGTYFEKSIRVDNATDEYLPSEVEAAQCSVFKKILYGTVGTVCRPFVSLL